MSISSTKSRTTLLDLSKYTYGTTGLNNEGCPVADRIKVVSEAMDAGVWFHTSDSYGTALSVLTQALDQDRAKTPNLIFKIGIGARTFDDLRQTITSQMTAAGIDRMQIGQLCIHGKLADDLQSGRKNWADLRQLREESNVDQFVLEVYPWSSDLAYDALINGHTEGVVNAFILYFNPLQRFASNKLWDLIEAKSFPLLALRTVGGGDVHALRDIPGAAWLPYLHDRAVEVAPLYEASNCKTWTEFCVRFAFGFPQVKTTVGSTIKISNLKLFLESVKDIKPLPADIQSKIIDLQYRWSDDYDVHADPSKL